MSKIIFTHPGTSSYHDNKLWFPIPRASEDGAGVWLSPGESVAVIKTPFDKSTLEGVQLEGLRRDWKSDVELGDTVLGFDDWLTHNLRKYKVTVERTSNRMEVVEVWAFSETEACDKAHALAPSLPFDGEDSGVEYEAYTK